MKTKTPTRFSIKPIASTEYFGGSVAPFVGRFGYPRVNIGILTPPGITDSDIFDNPYKWVQKNESINQITHYRSQLVNSRTKADIKVGHKLIDISKEIAMASKPVEVEVNLKRKPTLSQLTSSHTAPVAQTATVQKVDITSNPKINRKVDKIVDDTDLKATDAITYLYNNNFTEHFLSQLLSVGTMGIAPQRKFVPTRWSITATDDTLGKHLRQSIQDNNYSNYLAYFGNYLGNYYLIMFFPDVWSYELFETYVNSTKFWTDYENHNGRTTYASNAAGGYYSVRLAVLEHLTKIKRQGTVLALRFVTDEYTTPLGVWVTREAARKTLSQKPIEFANKELMLTYAQALIKKKFNYDINQLIKKSKVLSTLSQQKKLQDF